MLIMLQGVGTSKRKILIESKDIVAMQPETKSGTETGDYVISLLAGNDRIHVITATTPQQVLSKLGAQTPVVNDLQGVVPPRPRK
jgi:hypothetical protein